MNADWRYDDGKLHERQICLTCLIHNNIPINRNVYEFCNHVVSNGIIRPELPTEENPMTERLKKHNNDIFDMVAPTLLKEFNLWNKLNEGAVEHQKNM